MFIPGGKRGQIARLILWAILSFQARAAIIFDKPPQLTRPDPSQAEVLRENGLFFSILTGICLSLSISEPAFGFRVEHVNLNLITRDRKDPQGRQQVVVRVGGVVRSNYNVEMDLLSPDGTPVGRFFYGSRSGDLIAFGPDGKEVIRGAIDGWGYFALRDLRLDSKSQPIASGYFNYCMFCPGFEYLFQDAGKSTVASGFMYFWPEGGFPNGFDRMRTYWKNDKGFLQPDVPTVLEAEFDLRKESTGAVNGNLFDRRASAASFFAMAENPVPASTLWLPRAGKKTALTIINNSAAASKVTLAAYRFDGQMLEGDGIRNPAVYSFEPQSAWSAALADFIQGTPAASSPGTASGWPGDSPVWVEFQSGQAGMQVMATDRAESDFETGPALSPQQAGAVQYLYRLGARPDSSPTYTLLNPGTQAVLARLSLLDEAGTVLGQIPDFYVPARGFRLFDRGWLSIEMPKADLLRTAALKAESFSEKIPLILWGREQTPPGGLAAFVGDNPTLAEEKLWFPFFTVGSQGGVSWSSRVELQETTGRETRYRWKSFTLEGVPVQEQEGRIAAFGSVDLGLELPAVADTDPVFRGYLLVEATDGRLGGNLLCTSVSGNAAGRSRFKPPAPAAKSFQILWPGYPSGENSTFRYLGVAILNRQEHEVSVTLELASGGRPPVRRQLVLPAGKSDVRLLDQLFPEADSMPSAFQLSITSGEPVFVAALQGEGSSSVSWFPVFAAP